MPGNLSFEYFDSSPPTPNHSLLILHRVFIQAYIILLYFTLSCCADTACSPNWRLVTALHPASLLAPFSNSLWSLHVSVLHFGNAYNISHFFVIFCYSDRWSIIFVVTMSTVLGGGALCPCKIVNLIDKCVCSNCSPDRPFPCLFPSLILWRLRDGKKLQGKSLKLAKVSSWGLRRKTASITLVCTVRQQVI